MGRDLAFYISPHGDNRRSIMNDLADAGIRLIGIDGSGWDPDSTEGVDGINEFLTDLDEFGLKLHSMHATCSFLANADEETSPDLLAELFKELKRFTLLGGNTAVYHACWMRDIDFRKIDPKIARIGWDLFVERNAKTVKAVARKAAEHDISIVLENIPYSFHAQSFAGFADIVSEADEPNVGFILDSGHANIAESVVADEIRFAGKRLMDTHFHDNAGPVTGTVADDQHVPPGLGTIDWREAIRALNEVEFSGPVVFEGVLGPGDSIENGRFGGALSHKDLIEITIRNWRAFELLAEN